MSTVLTVGLGLQYQTIGAAIAAANRVGNDVLIEILAGTYTNDGGTITASNVTVESMGGVAKLVGVSSDPDSKAVITAAGNNTIFSNLDISGATGMGNAGVLYSSGTLSLVSVQVHDNQTGVASTDVANGNLRIETSHIDHNGSASGGGNIDVGAISTLTVYATSVRNAMAGSEIRSNAQTDTIQYSAIADLSGTAAHVLDLPHGGKVTVFDTSLERGPNATTNSMVSWGSSGTVYTGSSFDLAGNNVFNDVYPNASATFFDKVPATVTHTELNYAWNFPNLVATATPGTVAAMATRTAYPNFDTTFNYSNPTISTVTGMMDGGVTLRGQAWGLSSSVSVSETVDGRTTLLGTVTADPNGKWALTSHVKIDQTKIHSYTMSMDEGGGYVVTMRGALILADTGSDHLLAAAGQADVFTIMSFKGTDIIDGFKTTSSAGYGNLHDAIDFSGRGVSSFAQVQAMMTGSASTILTMSSGKTVTLTGVAPGTLSASDFVYS